MVTVLLSNGANVNHTNKEGHSPLLSAAMNGHEDVVAALLDNGADASHSNSDGKKPLDIAKTEKIKDMLIAHMKKQEEEQLQQSDLATAPNMVDEAQWFQAAKDGNLAVIQQGINNKIDVNLRDSKGLTALWWAARGDHSQLVDFLVKQHSDVNVAHVSVPQNITSACDHQLHSHFQNISTFRKEAYHPSLLPLIMVIKPWSVRCCLMAPMSIRPVTMAGLPFIMLHIMARKL